MSEPIDETERLIEAAERMARQVEPHAAWSATVRLLAAHTRALAAERDALYAAVRSQAPTEAALVQAGNALRDERDALVVKRDADRAALAAYVLAAYVDLFGERDALAASLATLREAAECFVRAWDAGEEVAQDAAEASFRAALLATASLPLRSGDSRP